MNGGASDTRHTKMVENTLSIQLARAKQTAKTITQLVGLPVCLLLVYLVVAYTTDYDGPIIITTYLPTTNFDFYDNSLRLLLDRKVSQQTV